MKKRILLILIAACTGFVISGHAQNTNDQKIVLITLDGYRWQELFTGADPLLIANKKYVSDTTSLKKEYWRTSPKERREALMPFVWGKVAEMGQIHGNRKYGSKVNVTNGMWFSYPGYNEVLTGKPDDKNIDSNSKKYNPNVTILEKLNKSPKYSGKVAAFASWDVFPYIINDKRSGVPVNAGFDTAKGDDLSETEKFINKIEFQTPSPFGMSARLDVFTDQLALEYMKRKHPDIIYIANDETDDFAHQGNYTAYLDAARHADAFFKELWEYTQNDPYYKGKTTFILTADHGRGAEPLDNWRDHGTEIKGADQVWFIFYGNQIKSTGEVKTEEQLYSTQVVKEIESLLK